MRDDAYRLQRGEFYPERHAANLRQLRATHPDRSLAEIESVYRRACELDPEARTWVESSQLTPGAKALLLEWLEQRFGEFSPASLREAIEHAIPPENA